MQYIENRRTLLPRIKMISQYNGISLAIMKCVQFNLEMFAVFMNVFLLLKIVPKCGSQKQIGESRHRNKNNRYPKTCSLLYRILLNQYIYRTWNLL